MRLLRHIGRINIVDLGVFVSVLHPGGTDYQADRIRCDTGAVDTAITISKARRIRSYISQNFITRCKILCQPTALTVGAMEHRELGLSWVFIWAFLTCEVSCILASYIIS